MSLISYSKGLSIMGKSPPVVRHLIESSLRPIPRSFLYGTGFKSKLDLLMKSEKYDLGELERYQGRLLADVVDHAYHTVPYYHDLLRSNDLRPGDITKLSDLRKLPVLTKDVIRQNRSSMTSSSAERYRPGSVHTSGSTGKPLSFMLDQQNREMALASAWRHLYWHGARDLNARVASFRRGFFDGPPTKKLWRWDVEMGNLAFDSHRIDSSTVRSIVAKLDKFKPDMIQGYPHSVYILSRMMEDAGISLKNKPTMIQTSSETLSPHMRASIEDVFDTTIYDWYGQSENVVTAGQCERGLYHQTMENGILTRIEDEWGMERMVGTGLWNYSMPLINYEVGDIVVMEPGQCACGRGHLAIRSIEGRVNDIILTTRGNAISGVGMDAHYKCVVLEGLRAAPEYYKFIQENHDHYSISFFSKAGMTEEDIRYLHEVYIKLLGEDAEIEIKQLDEVPRSNKWRTFESRLSFEPSVGHSHG